MLTHLYQLWSLFSGIDLEEGISRHSRCEVSCRDSRYQRALMMPLFPLMRCQSVSIWFILVYSTFLSFTASGESQADKFQGVFGSNASSDHGMQFQAPQINVESQSLVQASVDRNATNTKSQIKNASSESSSDASNTSFSSSAQDSVEPNAIVGLNTTQYSQSLPHLNSTLASNPSSHDLDFDSDSDKVASHNETRESFELLSETSPVNGSWKEKPTETSSQVTIRKCCLISEYFSIISAQCESSSISQNFFSSLSGLLQNISQENIDILPGPLKNCSLNNGSPLINQASNNTYLIREEGKIFDIYTQEIFSHSEYCLEVLGEDPASVDLTLAYCPKQFDSYYEYYDSNAHEVDGDEENSFDVYESEFVVRKCCDEGSYFQENEDRCAPLESGGEFSQVAQGLSFENGIKNLEVVSSRLTECTTNLEQIITKKIKAESYRLRYNGEIIDIATGIPYDSSQYCLEQFGNSSQTELSLTIVFCGVRENMIPKCCPLNHFFDSTLLECLPSKSKETSSDDRLLDIFQVDKTKFEVKPLSHLLSCKSTFPSQEFAKNIHFNGGNMCAKGNCYKTKDYCIELSRTGNMDLKPIAFFCHTDFYIKCCPQGQILNNYGCTDYLGKSSFLMKQLSRTRKAVTSFDYRKCEEENAVLLEESLTTFLQWWVGSDGSNLMVESEIETRQVDHYCIDDFANFKGEIKPSAFVCAEEIQNMTPHDLGLRAFQDRTSLGKCCQRDSVDGVVYYFSLQDRQCRQLTNRTLKNDSFIVDAGLTKEHFHDFPKCLSTSLGYHSYPLLETNVDHAVLTSEGNLRILSVEGKCISNEQVIESPDFCYEYYLAEDGTLQPLAFVCAHEVVLEVYHEKFGIVSTLLGISCVSLFAAFVYLLTLKVRRGLVYTRKINTLAGKILLSFIGSHLIGYISLSLTQHDNSLNKSGTVWCYLLAGFIQFFNLATFCWNTSICLESLLLTIHIRISEWLRYFLHSLWAWGFPAIMTTLMIVIDKHRDSLPCGTIAPKIGVHHCFHSDDDARLVYFYIPIFITLTANVLFIFGAKALRRSRLRKLEMGPRARAGGRPGKGKKDAPPEKQTATPSSSGMRTHQSHNVKAESLRIVLWTGGTWFLELAGFIITKYLLPHNSERWYDYLWYIPTSINALRGVGIFAIVVLTPDVRGKISFHAKRAHESLSSKFNSWGFQSPKRNDSDNSLDERGTYINRERNRNMSITTMISNLSSLYDASVKNRPDASCSNSPSGSDESVINGPGTSQEGPKAKSLRFSMIRSISQIERESSVSSTASATGADDVELEDGMQRRKSSITLSSAGSLPRLQEEESVVGAEHEVPKDEGDDQQSSEA